MLYLQLVEREKKKEKKQQGGFFPRAGHALLAGPGGIFPAVRCN
jgi:hypothetical protein